MLELITPNISHKKQWEEVMAEWGNDWRRNPRIFFQDSFQELLDIIESVRYGDNTEMMTSKSSIYFLFDNNELIGMYWIRHNLNYHDDAINGGHIGYGIRPSQRNKGYGKSGLRLVLQEAKSLGFLKVFISCDDDNEGSIKIIEANGGILVKEGLRYGRKSRRYEVDLCQKEKEILISLELELHTPECRHNIQRIDELVADDFFECGKTGKMFGKKECLEWLPTEKAKKITTKDISVNMLTPDIGQVRYISQIGGNGEGLTTSFRTSLWRKTESGWQMFFHQGTLIKSNN